MTPTTNLNNVEIYKSICVNPRFWWFAHYTNVLFISCIVALVYKWKLSHGKSLVGLISNSVFIIINLITIRQINSPINALFYHMRFGSLKMYNNRHIVNRRNESYTSYDPIFQRYEGRSRNKVLFRQELDRCLIGSDPKRHDLPPYLPFSDTFVV